MIYEATPGPAGTGAVIRGASLTQTQAVARRQGGLDVVVCGPNTIRNCLLAQTIETAIGPSISHPPHVQVAGPQALPHFQQLNGQPGGHTFYETPIRQAITVP
jgi:hypothetical protein